MWAASTKKNTKVIKALLQREEIDVNHSDKKYHFTALILAASNGDSEAVKELLKHKDIDVNKANEYGYTALIMAAKQKGTDSKSVKELLKHKDIDVNKADKYGNTALMHAVQNNNKESVKALLEHKDSNGNYDINVDLVNINSFTALDWAIGYGHSEIADLICDFKNKNN